MAFSFAPISGNYFWFKKRKAYSRLVSNLNETVFIDMANAVGAGSIISTAPHHNTRFIMLSNSNKDAAFKGGPTRT